MILHTCPTMGCRNRSSRPGKCDRCLGKQRQSTDRIRGTAAERGYGAEHERARQEVLARWPTCQCREDCYWHLNYHGTCGAQSNVADHYPWTKRELVSAGRDDHDPVYMRGLCTRCHNRSTGRNQPGGFGDGH